MTTEIRDILKDLVTYTHDLQCIDLIKIEGDDKETNIHGLADDKSVIVKGKFVTHIPDFQGTFGMPSMDTLKTILSISEYDAESTITVKADTNKELVGMHFENKAGDFKNDYRFMQKDIVNDQLKTIKFKGATWDVTLEPSMAAIQRLKFQAAANKNETTFIMKTENNDLKFYFGDHSTHAGNFVFEAGVTGTLKQNWHWPIARFITILSLAGDKTIRVSDVGVVEITVDSGLAHYTYMLPAHSK